MRKALVAGLMSIFFWRKARAATSAEEIVLQRLNAWKPSSVDDLLPFARESLDRVTALTEYEDTKAGRVITAIALLSAASGAVYAALMKDVVPLLQYWQRVFFHLLFFAYAITTLVGVFRLLRAIYPWFHIPDYWRKKKSEPAGEPKSMLFGTKIAEASPEHWVGAFETAPHVLKTRYLKDYIHETFLIARKVDVKYQRLRKAHRYVFFANVFLLPVWFAYASYVTVKTTSAAGNPATLASPGSADYTCFIVLDADNTLWDTDRLYAEAQLAMLDTITSELGVSLHVPDRLKFVRDIDQAIATAHSAGLKYPPERLAEGIIDALFKSGTVRKDCVMDSKTIIADAATAYTNKISEVPKLRVGVREGLRSLRSLGARTVICSEGVNESLLRNLNELDVLGYIDKLVVASKSPEVFRRLADDYNPYRKLQVSVGDQLDRDIQYAKSAGYKTVYFPCNFQPNWLPQILTVQPDVTIDSFALLPSRVTELEMSDAAAKRGRQK